jgi:hypothetical protein
VTGWGGGAGAASFVGFVVLVSPQATRIKIGSAMSNPRNEQLEIVFGMLEFVVSF